MMSPVLPIALAFAALALAHLRLGWRAIGIAVGLVAVVSVSVVLAQRPFSPELAFTLCWATVIASASTVIFVRRPPGRLALLLALSTGAATGLVAASTDGAGALLQATPAVVVLALATVRAWKGLTLLLQILAAWMLAVALLSATIPLVATPGYRSDHRE